MRGYFKMKTKVSFIIAILITFISCNHIDTNNNEVAKSQLTMAIKGNDTIYKDSKLLIIKANNSVDTFLKYTSNINDSLYFINPEEIKLNKKLNFSKYEYKKQFITRTTQEVQEHQVNFAGHYSFVYWGCRSPCKLSAVVDLKTGIVYDGIPSAIGYSFKKDSRILIVNPPDSSGWYFKYPWGPPTQYIWTGKKFKELKNNS